MNTLPDETNPEDDKQAKADADRAERLFALGMSLAEKRADAIEARKASGIEEEWAEDEEHYDGIDDANRKEQAAWRTKPPGQIQPEAQGANRSTVFINITAPYVDSAAASMADMLLPTDDRAWSLGSRPNPELAALVKGKVPRSLMLAAAQMYPTTAPGAGPHMVAPVLGQLPAASQDPTAGTPSQPPSQPAAMPAAVASAVQPSPVQPGQVQSATEQAQQWIQQQIAKAQEISDITRAASEKAQKRIEGWHIECQFHAVCRDAINDSAKIGTGIIKGPIPLKQKGVMFRDGALVIEEKIVPGSKVVSAWNLYPDGSCGESIHNGSHLFEKDELTFRQLFELKGQEGYIDSQIDQCLKEGAQRAVVNKKREADKFTVKAENGRFEVWYYYGYLDKGDLAACGLEISEEMMVIPAIITMVNNRPIRASLNPLDSGDFPYDVMPWSKRTGHWAGRGVARQGRVPQKMVNAGWRSLMDNAGIASGPMIIFRQGVVKPADGVAELRPRKVWMLAEDADATIAAEKAIGTIKVDMMVNELMVIIKEAMNLMEVTTGMPMLMQGQQGRAPDTLGGMQLLNNNSSVVRRRIAKMFDDCITEPHVRRYYRWLLQYGEDDSEKGDFVVDARGSSALVQRDLEYQTIEQMGNLVENRAFKIDPARWFAEHCRGRHLDPKRFQYTDEEFAELPPLPPPVEVQVAQIRAKGQVDGETARANGYVQAEAERAKQLADHAVAEVHREINQQNIDVSEADKDRQLEILTLHSNEFIEQQKQSGASAETVAQLKAMLAATTMKLKVQQQLSAEALANSNDNAVAKHMVDLHKHRNPSPQVLTPPTEPAGRARAGEAYAQ